MYGLINQAIRGLILRDYGADVWARCADAAAITEDTFLACVNHDDAVTSQLLRDAADLLNCSADGLMEAVGGYFAEELAPEYFASLFSFAGGSYHDLLLNLDDLHGRVSMAFPELDPPSFWAEQLSDDLIRLHYRSNRPGLKPLARGFLLGFGRFYGVTPEITEETTADGDRFLVRIRQGAAAEDGSRSSRSARKRAADKVKPAVDFASWVSSQGIEL